MRAIQVIKKLNSMGEKASFDSLYQRRLHRNVNGNNLRASKSEAWQGLMVAILSTQQRSTGPNDRTKDTLNLLKWRTVRRDSDAIRNTVNGFNHNRKKIDFLEQAKNWLDENWRILKPYQDSISSTSIKDWEQRLTKEREAADFLSDSVKGIGLKQSRNFWQYLGFSVWTIPLDSRIKSILGDTPFKINMSGEYEDIELEVATLCSRAKTFPCLLDATLFNLENLTRGYVGLPCA